VVVLGSGPNRIGQGVEFDYCCVHAVFALQEAGYETVMVNCNPETVSTDYDTADRLYFEPLTLEDVLEVCHREQPVGVLVQLGGQTPLKLAQQLEAAGVPIWGTSPDAIDAAEDRGRFGALMRELDVAMPPGGIARSFDEAREIAAASATRCWCGPPTCSGGRAMQIVYDDAGLSATSPRRWRRRPTSRSSSTASSRARSRSTSTRCTTARRPSSAGCSSTSRRPGSTPATRPARCRRSRSDGASSRRSGGSPTGSPGGSTSAGC
jgi:carbamoyl-phosphate synthase large subunit